MVNGPHEIYVERAGRLYKTEAAFTDDKHVLDLINRIVGSVGRRVDRSSPYVDARLSDGSRVNAVIPPLSLSGPVLTIRRFPKRLSTFDELVSLGTLTPESADFLKACVEARLDIVVSGGSGTGKTTTLNVLANAVMEGERIIVIEDSSDPSVKPPRFVPGDAPGEPGGQGRGHGARLAEKRTSYETGPPDNR